MNQPLLRPRGRLPVAIDRLTWKPKRRPHPATPPHFNRRDMADGRLPDQHYSPLRCSRICKNRNAGSSKLFFVCDARWRNSLTRLAYSSLMMRSIYIPYFSSNCCCISSKPFVRCPFGTTGDQNCKAYLSARSNTSVRSS